MKKRSNKPTTFFLAREPRGKAGGHWVDLYKGKPTLRETFNVFYGRASAMWTGKGRVASYCPREFIRTTGLAIEPGELMEVQLKVLKRSKPKAVKKGGEKR